MQYENFSASISFTPNKYNSRENQTSMSIISRVKYLLKENLYKCDGIQ